MRVNPRPRHEVAWPKDALASITELSVELRRDKRVPLGASRARSATIDNDRFIIIKSMLETFPETRRLVLQYLKQQSEDTI